MSGFGLASYPSSEDPNHPVSEFAVRADRFLIGIPGPGGSIDHPFVIGRVDGVPRISMSAAFIQDASIDSAKIRDATISSAHIQDLTIRGQKIEDFATSNMNAAQGAWEATVGLQTIGKRVLITAVRGWQIDIVTGYGGGESSSEIWSPSWVSVAYAWIEHPGPGYYTWRTATSDAYGRNPRNFYCAISAVELRK